MLTTAHRNKQLPHTQEEVRCRFVVKVSYFFLLLVLSGDLHAELKAKTAVSPLACISESSLLYLILSTHQELQLQPCAPPETPH